MEMQHSKIMLQYGGCVSVTHPVGTNPMSHIDPKLWGQVIKVFFLERYHTGY